MLIGPEHREVIELEALRCVVDVEGALFLREQLGHPALPAERLFHLHRVDVLRLHRTGADEATRHGVDLDAEARRLAELRRHVVGNDRPQLDDRVTRFTLYPPRPHHHALIVERQIGRVEEHDLANLGLEHIHAERGDGRSVISVRHGQLELDAVGSLDQPEHLRQLFGGEHGCRLLGHDYPSSLERPR